MEIILHKWFGCIVTLNSYFVNRNLVHFKIFFHRLLSRRNAPARQPLLQTGTAALPRNDRQEVKIATPVCGLVRNDTSFVIPSQRARWRGNLGRGITLAKRYCVGSLV